MTTSVGQTGRTQLYRLQILAPKTTREVLHDAREHLRAEQDESGASEA